MSDKIYTLSTSWWANQVLLLKGNLLYQLLQRDPLSWLNLVLGWKQVQPYLLNAMKCILNWQSCWHSGETMAETDSNAQSKLFNSCTFTLDRGWSGGVWIDVAQSIISVPPIDIIALMPNIWFKLQLRSNGLWTLDQNLTISFSPSIVSYVLTLRDSRGYHWSGSNWSFSKK